MSVSNLNLYCSGRKLFTMRKKKPIAENIQFILVGFMLILGGMQYGNYPLQGYFLMFLGCSLLGYAFYTLITHRRNFLLKLLAMTGELIALLTAAYILYRNDTNYLHFLYLLAAFGVAIAISVHLIKSSHNKMLN